MSSSSAPADRLERLVRLGQDLVSEHQLGSVLQRVADLAREVIPARYAALGMLAPDHRSLELFVTSGLDAEAASRIGPRPTGHGILGLVIREARPVRLPDLSRHPDSVGFPTHHPPMGSFLGVPMIGRHGPLGNLYLTERVGEPEFTPEDEHLAILLGTMAASAIENARHHEDSARLLTEVHELMRSRERFFAMVNHELRNSLAAVLGWAEMLVRKKEGVTVPRAAYEVLESAETAVGLINDLLDLSRLDEDRLRPVITSVDCGVVVRRAVTRVTPAATAQQVTVEVQLDGPTVCLTDRHRVEQILVNLLTNAIRHSPSGGTVTVRITHEPDGVSVAVADSGPGIPVSLLDKVFDLYFTKAGEEGSGTGLGLPLSRRLAALLGGDLSARNRPGGGAEFRLALPSNT